MADQRGPKRQKLWSAIPAFEDDFVADEDSAIASVAFGSADTVLRMLGEYTINTINAPVAGESARVGVGIGVFSTDAFLAGAVADPLSEAEYPWLYWADHPFHYSDVSTDPSQLGGSLRRTFDIRSMRKVKPRESLVFAMQFARGTGTVDLRIMAGQTRVLIALG